MKLELKDWIEEVKENFLCYEDGEKVAKTWETEFRLWVEDAKNKKKRCLKQEKGKTYFVFKDEDEVMETAESYLDAMEDGSIKKYWMEF